MTQIKDLSDIFKSIGASGLLDAVDTNRIPLTSVAFTPTLAPKAPPLGFPRIIPADELLSLPLSRPPEVIEGLLHRGSKMVLGGGSKSHKTWALLDLGISVATGQSWWGFHTTEGPVLVVNLEISEPFYADRARSLKQAKNLHSLGQLDILNLRGHAEAFEKLAPKLLQTITRNYSLIIIDPAYKVLGNRDENSAHDMGALLNEFDRMAEKTGSGIVFGAHFSKGNQARKESIDRMSGSGVFARDPDSILVMTRHEQENTFTVELTLRNFAPVAPFCVRWEFPLMHRDDSIDPARLKQAKQRGPKYTTTQLLDVLGDQNLSSGQWREQCHVQFGMSDRSFHQLKKILLEEERVLQNDHQKTFSRTAPAI